MSIRRIRATIKGKTWQEGDLWFSEADKLPIASFGKTPEEATSRAISALGAYLEACHKDKELYQVLKLHDLIEAQKSPEYSFWLETPVGAQKDDVVRA